MTAPNIPFATIPKESIPNLIFGETDVITDPKERSKRLWATNKATILGNGYHSKVVITFQTADGTVQRVNTTIWTFDQEFILLKSGSAIPLRCVSQIDFC